MSLKVATWNVNSLRVRLPHVMQWLADVQPDVLVLQETKMPDSEFLINEINQAGYHAVFSGQRTYNGVAILSRNLATDLVTDLPGLVDEQRRVLGITYGHVRILNLYIPNGESTTSAKFVYKLNWLMQLKAFLAAELARYPYMLVMGDFNIAPHPQDVYNPESLAGQVLFSEVERTIFQEMLDIGFKDCFRLHPQPEKSFSWWDYRLNAFKRNMGLRIDHILASSSLAQSCTQCFIDKTPRGWERPSDHTPVVAEFST